MNFQRFYKSLFEPVESDLGRLDPMTLTAIVGFSAGGPVSLSTIGLTEGRALVTYLTCELAVHPSQRPSKVGKFELLMTCDSQQWARNILTRIGDMSLEVELGPGHSLDIGAWVEASNPIQGVLLEPAYSTRINKRTYAILRCLGVTRDLLEIAVSSSTEDAVNTMKERGVYPNTLVKTAS